MSSELSVINDGLVRLGVPPIASLSDASAQSIGAENIYPRERAAALADFPWSFATKQVQPSQLTIPKGSRDWEGFEYVYQIPSDSVRIMGLASGADYWVSGSHLYTDVKEPSLVYIANVEESYWPEFFARAVSLRFAAATAIMLTDATTRADLMYQQAQQAMQRARSLDSQQIPSMVFNLMRIYSKRSTNFMAGA